MFRTNYATMNVLVNKSMRRKNGPKLSLYASLTKTINVQFFCGYYDTTCISSLPFNLLNSLNASSMIVLLGN